MMYAIMGVVAMLAILLSGIGPILGGKTITLSPTPPKPTGGVATGTGRFGGSCITKESLDLITAQPVALNCNGVDYVLAAENVQIPKIYIHPEKKLIERQNCGGVPYYSWYCHPPDYGSLWQNTLWKAVPDANKAPADGDSFNIYIKKTPDPNALFICSSTGTSTSSTGDALVNVAQAEQEVQTIIIGDREAIYNMSGSAFAIDIEQVPTRKKIATIKLETPSGPKEYDAWVNLLKAFSPDEDKALYLVDKGLLPESNAVPTQVPYKKYAVAKIFFADVTNKSLQLKTFRVIPTPAHPWWNIYLPESKPVVYLYPETKTEIKVKVKPVKGSITVSDPPYPANGWTVTADPSSSIEYKNATYPYLYYETEVAGYKIPEQGFVFEKKGIGARLSRLVERLGLEGRETREFVDYWVARFEKDVKTDFIFAGIISQEEMDNVVPLDIKPVPAAVIRVRLYFKGVEAGFKPKAPQIPAPAARGGFTVVEWGGILDD